MITGKMANSRECTATDVIPKTRTSLGTKWMKDIERPLENWLLIQLSCPP
jgi:hypothetical protein